MRSDSAVFCGRVRALKIQTADTIPHKPVTNGVMPVPCGLHGFLAFHTQFTHRVIHRKCIARVPQNAYLVSIPPKDPTCRVSGQKPNTTQSRISSPFLAPVGLNQTQFSKPKPLMRMATVFWLMPECGPGVAVHNCHPPGIRFEAVRANPKLRQGSGQIHPFLYVPRLVCPVNHRL